MRALTCARCGALWPEPTQLPRSIRRHISRDIGCPYCLDAHEVHSQDWLWILEFRVAASMIAAAHYHQGGAPS